ncbi:MAG: nitroreductase family protein [Coriobacteriia bacterium]|nr:nitroreductase family protein [Coriobacteriia bacterium]
MDAVTALLSRRSCRRYTDQEVSEQDVDTMLQAAMAAPSARNQQPWRFVLVRDKEKLARLSQATPHAGMLKTAALGVVVAGETRDTACPEYWVQDCSAATQNLLLAVHALGLGAVWIGVHPVPEREQAVRALVDLPVGVEALALIAIGHPAESKPPSERFEPHFVHTESW